MLKRNLKLAYRILIKNPLNSFITIIGLSVGIGCFLVLSLFVWDEYQTDRFHDNYDDIYCLSMNYMVDGKPMFTIPPPAGFQNVFNEIPGIAKSTRAFVPQEVAVEVGDKKFFEGGSIYIDPEWREIFDFEYANENFDFITDPSKIAISTAIAEKYFPNTDPIGKTINLQGESYIVDNVVLATPTNSSIDINFLISFEKRGQEGVDINSFKEGHTPYFLISKADPAELTKDLQKLMDEKLGAGFVEPELFSLKDFYYGDYFRFKLHKSTIRGKQTFVNVFTVIGLLILVIAIINYINLITARATERAKEVGIKKTIGAFRSNLIGQFLLESVLITSIAALLAFGFSELILKYFNGLIVKPVDSSILLTWEFMSGYAIAVLLLALLAGIYPAFVLSKFRPIKAISNNLKTGSGGASWLRNILITLQFSITTVLIFGCVVIIGQTGYLVDFDLGFDSDKIISVQSSEYSKEHIDVIKSELKEVNGVDEVSVGNLPGIGWMFSQKFGEETINVALNQVDEDFVNMAGLKILEGRNFTQEDRGKENVIINKTLRDLYFGDQPTLFGQLPGKEGFLIGVVDDFYFSSVKHEIRPLELKMHENEFANILIRVNESSNARQVVNDIQSAVTTADPDNVFEYHFIDQQFDDQFKSEMIFLNLIELFTAISIFIGVIGLFGLAQFSFLKRMGEMGIRKVLGATSANIIQILLKGFLKPVFIASVFGLPIGYYIMNDWLQSYTNQIDLSWGIYGVTLLSIVSVALITVLYQIIQAVRLKPVDTLKGE
ncbi:ABC transporter permease [Fulvivirga lutimaris]|uniref:ABC transporter permease n=1 Tax=Fulvivirga lutimaris TaxID=1819566 RepID=UPI0012BD5B35|nr:ABC transporter permease [Fulvivirga lutimaris]MTI40164.1 ABC transporter permease [Fulvivirga lutimaris]